VKFALDSILVRLIAAQVFVITLAFVGMLMMVGQQRGAAAARTIAPLWAEAAQQALSAQGVSGKGRIAARAVPGPPPVNADPVLAARYRVLRQELADQGLTVGEIKVSRSRGRETTWLEVQTPGGASTWVGFDGGVFGPEEPTQRWPVILFVLLLVTSVSGLLTWTIVRPLTRLEHAIERFRAQDAWPASQLSETPTGGPQELRRLEQSFAQMARERNQLERDRTLMLAGISHDLRSPLARIRLHADLLPDTEAAVSEAKQAIKRNVDLADGHLAAFLDFAAPSSADEWRWVDVESLWMDAAALALPEPQTLAIDAGAEPARVFTCPRLLVRVLATGLENAEKHGRAPIRASARQQGSEWVFDIEDDGPGLPTADRERVMRPFERGQHSRTTPGTGLGLALAQQIAQRLRGVVTLDQAGRGLVFRCTVPVVQEGGP
jgi:two-component system osmolarity sensor histidine kinase EnvZ